MPALLPGETDRAIGPMARFSACFSEDWMPAPIEPKDAPMVLQRIVGIALGTDDLDDHNELRHDPVLVVLPGQLTAERAPLAGQVDAEPA
jgi:hypothetical protein